MLKQDSIYSQGMKILVYSLKSTSEKSEGWKREGTSIAYFKNSVHFRPGSNFYTLTFTLTPKCRQLYIFCR